MFTWQARGVRNAITIHANFFDGDRADAAAGTVERALCFLPGTSARLMWDETNRRNIRWNRVVAQSDAVFEIGHGLVSLEYKWSSKRVLNPADWLPQVRLKDMLQCLAASVALAQHSGRTCAAVLRYHNVGLLLVPDQRVLDLVIGLIPSACAFHGQADISSSDLAGFAELNVAKLFPWRDERRSAQGVAAHARMFRRS